MPKHDASLAQQLEADEYGTKSYERSQFERFFILNVATIEEANQVLETDPAIKAKLYQT